MNAPTCPDCGGSMVEIACPLETMDDSDGTVCPACEGTGKTWCCQQCNTLGPVQGDGQ